MTRFQNSRYQEFYPEFNGINYSEKSLVLLKKICIIVFLNLSSRLNTSRAMIKKLIFTLIVLPLIWINGTKEVSAQDPHFSQYYANPIYLNPAFAGTAVCPRLILNYRNQWPSISGTFVTYNASYDQHIDKIGGGIGLMLVSDRAGEGALTQTIISGIYSYRLPVNREFDIRMSLQATYQQRSLDWDKLTFGDMIDPKFGFVYNTAEPRPGTNELNKGFIDFSTGILGYSKNFFAGVAVHHLTEPEEGFISISKLPRRYTMHAGMIIPLTRIHSKGRTLEDPVISPNIMYMQQMQFKQLNYGFYLNRYPFVGGVWFRQNFENPDAFIVMAGLVQSTFKLGYSYDITVSKLTNVTGGAHEVSFAWQFKCPIKRPKVRTINCPSF